MKFTIQQWLPSDSPSGGTLTYYDGTQYPKQPAIPINQKNKKVKKNTINLKIINVHKH